MRLQIPFSVLDLSNVRLGETPRAALHQTVVLARHVEALGFKRFWLAEHHGVLNSASAATSVLIGHVAGKTSVIRVGSGGVMLPNHPPLVIAEQFGTLASLYPDRIDLGLGRAAGGHDGVLQALRVGPRSEEHTSELQSHLNLVCRLLLEKKKHGFGSARQLPHEALHLTALLRYL